MEYTKFTYPFLSISQPGDWLTQMPERYHVFLSHNSTDKPAVEDLARRLRELGLNPFLDKWHLIPGEPWQEALEEALDQSATVAVFIGPQGISPWHNEEMRSALETRAGRKDFRVIPVLLPGATMPERGELPRFLSRLTWVDFRSGLDDQVILHRLVSGVHGVAPGPDEGVPSLVSDETPYRGLEKFRPQDARWFFGREPETQQLVEKLRTAPTPTLPLTGGGSRFLAILGASGSGKSSVVLAGLVPALEKGALPGSEEWPVIIFTPTEQPLEELAVRLADLVPGESANALRRELEADERALHLTVRRALKDAPKEQKVLLVVDQFEEVFTLCGDRDEAEQIRKRFFDNLLYAAGVEGGRTIVTLTMRADFLHRCADYPELADRLSAFQFIVTPMVESQIREAIEGPAARAGLELEAGLTDLIMRDLADQPGGLPLLEHALYELWKRREGRQLTYEAYRNIEGVTGALAQTAENTYTSLDKTQQAIAQRVLLELVQPGEGAEDTRRRARRSDLIAREQESEDVDLVLRQLADARLITVGEIESSPEDEEKYRQNILAAGGEITISVAHEALIRNWPALRRWIDQNRENLRTHRRLQEAAREWENRDRNPGWLYSGARLAQAQAWADAHGGMPGELVAQFLTASRRSEQKSLRRQFLGMGAILVFLIAAIYFYVSNFVLVSIFSQAEAKNVEQNVLLVVETMNNEYADLNNKLGDWAAWDDTYAFVQDHNQTYIDDNLYDSVFEAMEINMMLFYNTSDKLVFQENFDLIKTSKVPPPESLQEHLTANPFLLHHEDTNSSVSGFILLPEGPFMVASQPIRMSFGQGPIQGTMMMARYLDDAKIQELEDQTRLSITITRLDTENPSAEISEAVNNLTSSRELAEEENNQAVFIKPLNAQQIAGYTFLETVYGEPGLLMRVDMVSIDFSQAKDSLSSFILSLLGIGLLFVFLTLVILRRLTRT